MRSIIRTLKRPLKSLAPNGFLFGKKDLPSVKEFVSPHYDNVTRGRAMKGMSSSDPATIAIAKEILANAGNKQIAGFGFFEEKIFSQPPRSSSEVGSIKVYISDIRDFPEFVRDYEARKQENVMLCVGGPAAEDQSILAGIISGVRERLDEIIYMTRDYKESNVNHSAKQSHARHGNALNADDSLTGHALLSLTLIRKLIGVSPEEVLEPDYKKIDIEFTIDPAKLKIYFGNELNWLKQKYKKLTGQLTEHDINRLESLLSQEILNIVEKETGIKIGRDAERAKIDSSSIHVTFTEENTREVIHENEEFKRVGIEAEKLTKEELNFFFGEDNQQIHSAFKYPGDTSLEFNTHELNQEIAERHNVLWLDEKEVSRILLTQNEKKEAIVAGIITKTGEYFYANKLHFTGGYKVSYSFDRNSTTRFLSGSTIRNFVNKIEDIFDLQNPLRNEITVSTGVSINAIFKKSDRIKRIIERYGSTGEIAVTNSHWTMIAQNDNYIVMRITGGGNTGSEEYHPAYFLNVIANTRRIFGDDLIGFLSTYGCPRAINARNSTEFAKIAEGGIISYGKGGTGNTKRHAEAAVGLMLLGFEEEVVEYFNKFHGRKEQLIGDELKEIYEHIQHTKFLHDNVKRTNRRMGYDPSLSAEEIIAIIMMIASLAYILKKSIKINEERVEKIPDTTVPVASSSIKPLNATTLQASQQERIK